MNLQLCLLTTWKIKKEKFGFSDLPCLRQTNLIKSVKHGIQRYSCSNSKLFFIKKSSKADQGTKGWPRVLGTGPLSLTIQMKIFSCQMVSCHGNAAGQPWWHRKIELKCRQTNDLAKKEGSGRTSSIFFWI